MPTGSWDIFNYTGSEIYHTPKIVSLEAVMANKPTRLDSRFVDIDSVPSAQVQVTTHANSAATC